MKECPHCHFLFTNNYTYCGKCGQKLHYKLKNNINSKIVFIVLVGVIIASICIGITVCEINSVNNVKSDIENYKIIKQLSEPSTYDLKINSNWTLSTERNYIYINGSVKNQSTDKTINYFKIVAKFYDSYGNVIDSDWTNDSEAIFPGETRSFKIMHKSNANIKTARLFVEEVS